MHVVSIKQTIVHSLTSQTFSVTQSHTGISGSNVMLQIEVNRNLMQNVNNFQKDELLVLT